MEEPVCCILKFRCLQISCLWPLTSTETNLTFNTKCRHYFLLRYILTTWVVWLLTKIRHFVFLHMTQWDYFKSVWSFWSLLLRLLWSEQPLEKTNYSATDARPFWVFYPTSVTSEVFHSGQWDQAWFPVQDPGACSPPSLLMACSSSCTCTIALSWRPGPPYMANILSAGWTPPHSVLPSPASLVLDPQYFILPKANSPLVSVFEPGFLCNFFMGVFLAVVLWVRNSCLWTTWDTY